MLPLLLIRCLALTTAFTPHQQFQQRANIVHFVSNHKDRQLKLNPLYVGGNEVAEATKIVDFGTLSLLLAPFVAVTAGAVALARKEKLSRVVASTEESLEEIKEKIKSADSQITVRK